MALARYDGTAVDTAGNVIPNATVEVRRDQPGRPVVPLWGDRDGTVPLGNPIQTDAQGQFGFHVAGGVFYIRIFTGPSQQPTFQKVLRYVGIGTAAERDVEDLASALEAGTATFPTLPELDAFTPSGEAVGGKVTTGEDAGFYHYDMIEEEWVFDRPLYDTLARMTVTGGTADAVEASIGDGIPEASVIAFMIKPTLTNTGAVTINGKPVRNVNGDPLVAGEFPAGRWITFTDEGANYQFVSDPSVDALLAQAIALAGEAEEFRDEAEGFRDDAAGYAAGLNIPAVAPGDAGKSLRVKEDETGSEWVETSVDAGDGINVDNSDPNRPIISAIIASEEDIEDGPPDNKLMTHAGTVQAIGKYSPRSMPLGLALALSEATGIYTATGDLFADGFVSLGMVNVAGATGLDSSEAGVLKPTSTGETYSTTADPILTGNAAANSQSNNTNRFRIPASVISVSGDRVRVTFKAATSGPLNILQAYVGHAGAGSDFDGTQVQLKFSGATSVNVAAGASLESDPVSYSLDETKDLMVSLAHGTSSTNAFNTGQAGYNFYSRAGVSDASATITTGYTPDPNSIACVDLVRVRTSPGVTANLNVASETIPALTPINVVSGELRVVPTTALTLNTDLFMDISRNAGGAWTPVDLQLFFQDGGTSVLRFGETDLSGAPAGAALRYRIRSANNKAFKAAGVALGISA